MCHFSSLIFNEIVKIFHGQKFCENILVRLRHRAKANYPGASLQIPKFNLIKKDQRVV